MPNVTYPLYRIRLGGRVELVDSLETYLFADDYIADNYLYDAPAGERYFLTDWVAPRRVLAEWVVRFDGRGAVTVVGRSGYKFLVALPPVPHVEYEPVSVAFRDFDSPSKAAAYAGSRYTYQADAKLKLTIGDKVIVPVGDRYHDVEDREATVVGLNAENVVGYLKTVKGRA